MQGCGGCLICLILIIMGVSLIVGSCDDDQNNCLYGDTYNGVPCEDF